MNNYFTITNFLLMQESSYICKYSFFFFFQNNFVSVMLKRLLILIKFNYILNIKYPFFIQYQIRHRMLCSYENKTKNNPKKEKLRE